MDDCVEKNILIPTFMKHPCGRLLLKHQFATCKVQCYSCCMYAANDYVETNNVLPQTCVHNNAMLCICMLAFTT